MLLAASLLLLSLVSSAFASNTLQAGQSLLKGQSLNSTDGRFTFAMQADGNLVHYNGSNVLWSTGTNGARFVWYDSFFDRYIFKYPERLMLTNSGVLKITDLYDSFTFMQTDTQSWINSNYRIPMVHPTYGDTLIAQDDGNVVLYDTHSNSS